MPCSCAFGERGSRNARLPKRWDLTVGAVGPYVRELRDAGAHLPYRREARRGVERAARTEGAATARPGWSARATIRGAALVDHDSIFWTTILSPMQLTSRFTEKRALAITLCWVVALAVTGSTDVLLFLAPALLIAIPLFCGHYFGEELIAKLVARRPRKPLRSRLVLGLWPLVFPGPGGRVAGA